MTSTSVQTTPASIPDPTPQELELQQINLDYARPTAATALQLQAQAAGQIPWRTINPDYQGIAAQGANQIAQQGQALQGVTSAVAGQLGQLAQQTQGVNAELASGKINPTLWDAQQRTIQAGAENTLGNLLAQKAQQGTIGTSQFNTGVDNIAGSVSSALNDAYASNLAQSQAASQQRLANTQGLMNQTYNLGTGLVNANTAQAYQPLQYAGTAEQTALQQPISLFALGTGQAQPSQSMWQTYMNQRTAMASPETTTVQQGNAGSVFGGLASIGAAAICFIADTMIQTPTGDVPIQDINVGDVVMTFTGHNKVQKTLSTTDQQTIKISTNKGSVTCTPTEVFLTVNGPIAAMNLVEGDIMVHNKGGAVVESITEGPTATVYEIVVPWFFANGFCVDGFDPEVK